MRPGDRHASSFGQVPQPASGGVAVHPGTAAVEQDRPSGAAADSLVDGPANGREQWQQHNLGALPAHAQHPVAMLFTKVDGIKSLDGTEDRSMNLFMARHSAYFATPRKPAAPGAA
jgi:hypothetical protein